MDIEWVKLILKFAFDRKSRLLLLGYRPEVICLVKSTGEDDHFLLVVPEADHAVWIPPQEGILPEESISDAAIRCLKVELGLDKTQLQFRRSDWIGRRILPRYRWGERDLHYSLRRMRGKGYFAALVIADADAIIVPNPAEVFQWEWVDNAEFYKRIESNAADKKEILNATWKKLMGRGQPSFRAPDN